jgi:hypothetical protein
MQFKEVDDDIIDFVPTTVLYKGPPELAQHSVRHTSICSATMDGKKGIVAEVVFDRPLFTHLLTTVLPTIILLAISQMVTSFSDKFLDMVIQVNLTVLLVLATL